MKNNRSVQFTEITRSPDCCCVCGGWDKTAVIFRRHGKQKLEDENEANLKSCIFFTAKYREQLDRAEKLEGQIGEAQKILNEFPKTPTSSLLLSVHEKLEVSNQFIQDIWLWLGRLRKVLEGKQNE